MEIDKIESGKYVTYKTTEAQKTGEQDELHQTMSQIANDFYADVTQVSTDEDAKFVDGEEAVADKDTYQIVKDYVDSQNGGAADETTAISTADTEEPEATNATFADANEVTLEVESLMKEFQSKLKSLGATDDEISKLNYIGTHFDAETFLNDNPEATLSDLETEITKEVEKETGKSL